MKSDFFRHLARTRRLAIGLVAALAAPFCLAQQTGIDLVGINMSGAGFAPHVLPGKEGTNYFYPKKEHFQYYAERNIRLIRFPFIWERVQHELYKGMDTQQIRMLRETLDLAHEHGQKIILDMHNYGRYQNELIGSSKVSYEDFANIWRKLANTFKDHPALHGYDIMNEPHDTAGLWPGAAQAAINAIREVDMQTLIFVEGERWSSAYHWPSVNPSFPLKDPADKIVYEGHLYFDRDFSGRYQSDDLEVDPMLGVERARPFIEWLKEHGQKGFLGEYGIPDTSESMLVAMDNLLIYLNENCVPSAYWAGGPGWGTYRLTVEPRDGKDRPQMEILQKNLANDCKEYGPTRTQ